MKAIMRVECLIVGFMTHNWIVLGAFCFWMALSAHSAIAQAVDPQEQQRREEAARARQERAQQIADENERKERQRSIDMLREFMGECLRPGSWRGDERCDIKEDMRRKIEEVGRGCARNCELRFPRLQQAVSEFKAATGELEQALSFKSKLKDPAKKMKKSTAALLDFVKFTNRQHPRFDSSEFKCFTQSELGWETVRTAENLSPYLNTVIESSSVDIAFLESLPKFEAQLLRLQWLLGRLK